MAVNFDFVGSLQLATDLETVADELGTASNHRNGLRDTALHRRSFKGPYAKRHREFADLEDEKFPKLIDLARDTAKAWAEAWAKAANEHNDLVESEARHQMAVYDERRMTLWRIRRINDPFFAEPPPRPGRVDAIRNVDPPTGPPYDGGDAFGVYDFGPDDMLALPAYRNFP